MFANRYRFFLMAGALILAITWLAQAAPRPAPAVDVDEVFSPAVTDRTALEPKSAQTIHTALGSVNDGPAKRMDEQSTPLKGTRVRTAAATLIQHGEFGGAPYALNDGAAVAAFKGEAASIAAGGYASDVDYKSLEACLISFDNHSTYATDRGGCIYIQSVITGLQAGDIVMIDNDYLYDDGSGYLSFWDQAPYWLLIGSYTHNPATTINNWLIYVEPDGMGGFTMVAGSGEYNLALNDDDLTTILGDRFKLTRQVRVYQGATLVSPAVSGRGYTYSSSGITGGTEIDNSYLDSPDLKLVGADPVWVDDDWTGSSNGDIAGGHVYGQDAFDNIQQAIAGVLAGGTVNIAAGTYAQNLVVDKTVWLNGAGEALVTLYPSLSAPNPGGAGSIPPGSSNAILVSADNIEISGITVDGDNPGLTSGLVVGGADLDARNGIITNHPAGLFNGLIVHDCTVQNIYLRGIYASSGGTFNFHDNAVDNVQGEYASIGIFNFGGSGMFANNTANDCNDAISSNHSKGCQFLGNIVTNSGSGIHTDNAGSGGGVADLIDGNQISNSLLYGYGIFTFAPYIAPTIQNNTITNVDVGLTAAGSYSAVTPQFLNNTVDGQSKPNSTGMYITTEIWGYTSGNVSVLMQNNSITNNTDGSYLVAEAGFTNSMTFFDNELRANSNTNVYVESGALGAGTFLLNMSGTWWGTTSPGTITSMMVGSVDYTPWLGGGTATSPGFSGDFSQLWVDDDSPQLDAANRVQEAIDLVSGSTITLMPGLYVGQVAIDGFTDLDLIGSGIGSTTLQAPITQLPSFFITGASTQNRPVLMITNCDDVAVSDLTVDGAGQGNVNYSSISRFMGIGYRNSGGSITDVEVKDTRDNPLSGAQHGLGIYAFADNNIARALDILDCQVYGFQKNGITLIGDDLTASVMGCTITGAGPLGLGLPAQNGIQLSTLAGGTVSGNQFSDISYVPDSYIAAACLLFGPENLMVNGNTIDECQVGAYFIDAAGTFSGNIYTGTPTGMGQDDYYSLYALSQVPSKSNARQADPIDVEIVNQAKSDQGSVSLSPSALSIIANENVLDGGGGASCQGLVAYSYTSGDLVFEADGNRITNFTWGAGSYAGPSPVSATLTNNEFLFNGTGFESFGGTVSLEFNTFQNTVNATDDTPSNFYDQNCWSDWSGVGPYAIGGGGGNVDYNPRTDCGLDMNPATIIYECAGDFTFKVDIGSAVTALDAANIWIEYPAELTVSNVAGLDANFFLAYSQTTNILNTRDTLQVNLGVLTGVDDGPDSLFRVMMNGSTSCLSGDITMIFRDLRDSTNSPIIVPLASPIDFESNCADPTIVVNSPAPGGFYNSAPVLDLTANDDCDLEEVYYQIDGCLPAGWILIAGGLSGTSYNNPSWSMTPAEFNALSEAVHCIRFRVIDDLGGENSDQCTFTWCFTKDVTPPAPPVALVAQPGHNKIQLNWTNSSSPDAIGVQIQRVPWTSYPDYGSVPTLTPAPAYPANEVTGTTIHTAAAVPSTADAHLDVMGLNNATRDIYYYGAFAYDAAGNYSAAAASAQARATSYWLGDIASAFDGSVYFTDLVSFTSTYGLSEGQIGFLNHADFGPTHNNSPKGIPLPDDQVEFEDLAIFAINFNNVAPLLPKNVPTLGGTSTQSSARLVLQNRIMPDGHYVDLYLDNPGNSAKSVIGVVDYDPRQLKLVSANIGSEIANPSLPIFFKPLEDRSTVSVSLAVLGSGSSINGSGVIATLRFERNSVSTGLVRLIRADARDSENRPLIHDTAVEAEPDQPVLAADAGEVVVMQNSPNPFNPETKISYSLPNATRVSIRIYNVLGQEVRSLVDDFQSAGTHEVVWNGTNDVGQKVASGIYFYRFETAEFQKTVKMTMLK